MSNTERLLPIRAIGVLFAALCLLAPTAASAFAQDLARPAGWTDESHGNRVPANYDVVLPDDRINEIYINFTAEAWAAEEADMVEIYGERGASGGRGGPGGRGIGRLSWPNIEELAAQLDRGETEVRAALEYLPDLAAVAAALDIDLDELIADLGLPEGFAPPAGFGGPGAGTGRQGGGPPSIRNPIWAPVTVEFDGQTWRQVGFRYKGNTALSMSWGNNAIALPFKLDFDEFEDDNPELDNQRFYGFKQLGFGNNFDDPSLQREKVAADVFRAAGVPAAQTAFYAVYVDSGNGQGFQSWGFYTAVELPDDTLIESQFADDDGNMYKPSGGGATFAAGSFTEASFPKRTNRDTDFADVLAVFEALHAETRLSNPAAWRESLEAVFDVERFLRWLATNRFVQKRDTYGVMAKDFYLYADRASGQLVWIPWDNNEAMDDGSAGPGGRNNPGTAPGRGGQPAWTFSLEEIIAEVWPLIGFLLEDEVYSARFLELITHVSTEVFSPERMEPIYEANFRMLADYLEESEGSEAIDALRAATDDLIAHVNERAAAADAFLREHAAD